MKKKAQLSAKEALRGQLAPRYLKFRALPTTTFVLLPKTTKLGCTWSLLKAYQSAVNAQAGPYLAKKATRKSYNLSMLLDDNYPGRSARTMLAG